MPGERTLFDRYRNYCDCLETTPLYVEYSFYSLIAGCLQRRVWLASDDWKIFPNLYLVFVGDPATGKTVAARVNLNILDRLKDGEGKQLIPRAPDTISVEALIRKLAFGIKIFKDGDGISHAQSAMTFLSEELANLFKKGDQQLTKFLLQGYDCGSYSKELKGDEKINSSEIVTNLCLNFLAATTPSNMMDFMNQSLMDDGFLGRAIFIYGGYPKSKRLFFTPTPAQREDLKYVEDYVRCLSVIAGQMTLSQEALDYLTKWHESGQVIINEDRKLQFYYGRKKINAIKLAMCHHVSIDYKSKVIGVESVKEALAVLGRAEIDMHRALASTSKNPVHLLAEVIASFLEDRKRCFPNDPKKYRKRANELHLLFNSDGDSMQVNKAMEYLIMCKRVKTSLDGMNIVYEGLD